MLVDTDETLSKTSKSRIDLSVLDSEAVSVTVERKGIDLSMLEILGLSFEDVSEIV